MSTSILEKLVVIMHKFGIDFNEYNVKFENIQQEDASALLEQEATQEAETSYDYQPLKFF